MYGMPPAYHTRRSYVTLCEAFCGRPRPTLQASAWPHSLGVRETSSRGNIKTENQWAAAAHWYSVLIPPLDDVSQKVDFEDRHSQFTVSERSIAGMTSSAQHDSFLTRPLATLVRLMPSGHTHASRTARLERLDVCAHRNGRRTTSAARRRRDSHAALSKPRRGGGGGGGGGVRVGVVWCGV